MLFGLLNDGGVCEIIQMIDPYSNLLLFCTFNFSSFSVDQGVNWLILDKYTLNILEKLKLMVVILDNSPTHKEKGLFL